MATFTRDICDISDAEFFAEIERLLGAPRRSRRAKTELHHHKCDAPSCGKIWAHREADFHSSAEFEAGHHCPACGTEQLYKCDPQGRPLP